TAPVQVNQGGQVSFVVPKAGVNLPVTMSPSEKDASARGWATVKQGQERIGIEKTKAASGGAGGGNVTEGERKAATLL
ncbi:hypothetical protein M3M33_17150, partial [Loigolactobacillus coryniformis]|uniref:hypothetical protein n=1 Tax=Loigolactobacillus coryniformis TaxID=1610 RepID=UPI00201A82F6